MHQFFNLWPAMLQSCLLLGLLGICPHLHIETEFDFHLEIMTDKNLERNLERIYLQTCQNIATNVCENVFKQQGVN